MVDTTNTVAKSGFSKETTSGVYLAVCQNITPVIVSYLCAHYPALNETVWFEVVVFALAGVGGAIVKFTPHSFVEFVTNIILFGKNAWSTWRNAANS